MDAAQRWKKREMLLNVELAAIAARTISDQVAHIEFFDGEEEIQYVPKGTADETLSYKREVRFGDMVEAVKSATKSLLQEEINRISDRLPKETEESEREKTATEIVNAVKSAMQNLLTEETRKILERFPKTDEEIARDAIQESIALPPIVNNPVSYTIHEVDSLSDIQFEHFTAELFKGLGFATNVTRKSGDYGVDVSARNELVSIGIQCKHLSFSGSVGVEAVQEVVTGIRYWNLDKGIVLTNRTYTVAAKRIAIQNHITLLDRKWLCDKLIELDEKS